MTCSCRCHSYGPGANVTCDTGPVQPGGNRSCSPCDGSGESEAGNIIPAKLLTTRDHWDAVDALTRPRRTRLVRDNGSVERYPVPSLLDQLYDAMESGAGAKTHGVPASKPPVDAACLSLLLEIAQTVRHACHERKIRPTFDNAADLRALCTAVNGEGDPERIDAAARLARTWTARIRATISNDPDRSWRMHGAACRTCGSTQVPAFDEDGAQTHLPALIVQSADGLIESIRCDFCGSTLDGPDLVQIVRRAPRHTESA